MAQSRYVHHVLLRSGTGNSIDSLTRAWDQAKLTCRSGVDVDVYYKRQVDLDSTTHARTGDRHLSLLSVSVRASQTELN